jgi:hypothetical protein
MTACVHPLIGLPKEAGRYQSVRTMSGTRLRDKMRRMSMAAFVRNV